MDFFGADMMLQQQMEQNAFMQDQMYNQQMMMQDQAFMGQQMMPQMMPQMLIPPQIAYDRYGMPKIHKKQALDMLRYDLQVTTGCRIMKEYKIEEEPDLLRHCCVYSGISQLPKNEYPIQAVGVVIPYYFCKSCGTLFIYDDFYI